MKLDGPVPKPHPASAAAHAACDWFETIKSTPRSWSAAAAALQERGVDLIVSNQSHAAWAAALAGCGFGTGPSNFIFAASKKLAALLDPWSAHVGRIHLTRGDGDGPIHL